MHILMADDDKDDFIILEEAVEKSDENISVSYAANWLELWRILMKALPDLILLDLNMPVKSGLECLSLLRSDKKFNDLPIIIYSTSTNKVDIDKAYEHGANYFIVKPDKLEDLITLLTRLKSMSKERLAWMPPKEEFVMV